MKTLLVLTFLYVTTTGAFAQEAFIKACNSPKTDSTAYDIQWFQYLYRTKDCNEIAAKLSKITSLAEMIQPFAGIGPELKSSWTNSFPHIYGHLNTYEPYVDWRKSQGAIIDQFKELAIYADFPNITAISYTRYTHFPYTMGVCEAISMFPNLKTISIENEYFNTEADQCLSDRDLEVILTGRTLWLKKAPIKSNIIGIEQFMGDITELLQLGNLQYLGITDQYVLRNHNQNFPHQNRYEAVPLATLGSLPNLTHLTIVKSNIENIQDLKHSFNLTWLSIACAASEDKFDQSPCVQNKPFLKNLDFISNLVWLNYLDLSNNLLDSVPDFSKLKNLKTLKLRRNLIKKLPWSKTKSSIDYLDLSGNNLSTLEGIEHLTNLTFLNVSGNQVSDFSSVDGLKSIKFLNLSNNPSLTNLSTLNPVSKLKVLNLNGGCHLTDLFDIFKTERLFDVGDAESEKYFNSLNGDFKTTHNLKKDFCSDQSMILNTDEFHKFKGLEVLSLRYNNLKNAPDLSKLSSLKLVNLEDNLISKLDSNLMPKSLEIILAKKNRIKSLPNLLDYPALVKIDLSHNLIKNLDGIQVPNRDMALYLSHNRISNISVLDKKEFSDISGRIDGNRIKVKNCPSISYNVRLQTYCRNLEKGYYDL